MGIVDQRCRANCRTGVFNAGEEPTKVPDRDCVRDALTPDVRSGHTLYDATVNDMKQPRIFVTYHDAQAYPEYLIRFKQ